MGPALQAMPLRGGQRLAQVTQRGLQHLVQEGTLQSLQTNAMEHVSHFFLVVCSDSSQFLRYLASAGC